MPIPHLVLGYISNLSKSDFFLLLLLSNGVNFDHTSYIDSLPSISFNTLFTVKLRLVIFFADIDFQINVNLIELLCRN
jgi:hypothetical protein